MDFQTESTKTDLNSNIFNLSIEMYYSCHFQCNQFYYTHTHTLQHAKFTLLCTYINTMFSYSFSTFASALVILFKVFSVSSKRFLISRTFCINKCGGAVSEELIFLLAWPRGERWVTSIVTEVFTLSGLLTVLFTVLFRVTEKSSSGLFMIDRRCMDHGRCYLGRQLLKTFMELKDDRLCYLMHFLLKKW